MTAPFKFTVPVPVAKLLAPDTVVWPLRATEPEDVAKLPARDRSSYT